MTNSKRDPSIRSRLVIISKLSLALTSVRKATFNKEKLVETMDIKIDLDTTIKELEVEGSYEYIGMNKGDEIHSTPLHSTLLERKSSEILL